MAADFTVLFILIIRLVYRILNKKERKIKQVQTLKGKDQIKITAWHLKRCYFIFFYTRTWKEGKANQQLGTEASDSLWRRKAMLVAADGQSPPSFSFSFQDPSNLVGTECFICFPLKWCRLIHRNKERKTNLPSPTALASIISRITYSVFFSAAQALLWL